MSAIARALYGLSSLESIGELLMSQVGDLIGHHSFVFCALHRKTSQMPCYAYSQELELPKYMPMMAEIPEQIPFIPHYNKHPGSGAMRLHDLVRPAEWRKSPLRNEFFRPLGIDTQLGVEIPGHPEYLRGLMLNRDTAFFSDWEVRVLDLLREHIAAASAIADQWQRLERHEPSAPGMPARRSSVIVNSRGRPILWGPGAQCLLADYANTGAPQRRALPARVSQWAETELARFRDETLWRHPRRSLKITNRDRHLMLRLSSSDGGECHVILLEEDWPADDRSACLLKLTKRERQVLAQLAEGKSNEQIALILGINVQTVKTHVKRILETLGVDNRAAAAAVWIRAGG